MYNEITFYNKYIRIVTSHIYVLAVNVKKLHYLYSDELF